MITEEIIAKVKRLNLPAGEYVVFGSAPLAVAGLREANDIDLLVSSEILANLKTSGWQELRKGEGDTPLVHDVFEAHDNWNFSSYSPMLADLLVTATWIDGISFASLMEVRKWKVASARPKDLEDISLIDQHIDAHKI